MYTIQQVHTCDSSSSPSHHCSDPMTIVFEYDSITVSYARELTSVSMRYSQGDGFNTSLSRFMYCTHE